MTADILIEGIALVATTNGGDCLAHWVIDASDREISDAMRKWAGSEIAAQDKRRHRENVERRRAGLHMVASKGEH